MECTQKKLCPKRGSSLWFLEQHRIPDQWFSRSNGLPDFAWFCLILPDFENAWKRPDFAWNCLISPEIAWFCLKLPDSAWFCLELSERAPESVSTGENKSQWYGNLKVTDFVWCVFCLELSENAGKEWGPWATLLPRPLGFSIMGKQTPIMNVSIWFLLFEGLSFCFGERERESANQSFWKPERVSSWNHYYMDSSPFLAFELDLTLWHGYGICAALRHWWGNEHAVQAACWCMSLPGLAWNGLKMPDSAWCNKVKNQEPSVILNENSPWGIQGRRAAFPAFVALSLCKVPLI